LAILTIRFPQAFYFSVAKFFFHNTMKKLLIASTVALALAACNNGSSENAAVPNDVKITRKTMDSEVNKTVANLSIDGMTCSAGCGGKIQQELRALQGVSTTDLDFQENRPENVVTVEFDPNQIDENKFIQTVQSIADGQYHVRSVEIIQYRGLQSHGKSTDVSMNNGVIDFGMAFQLLDLLQTVPSLGN
jgi:copper chaperone CopZ